MRLMWDFAYENFRKNLKYYDKELKNKAPAAVVVIVLSRIIYIGHQK